MKRAIFILALATAFFPPAGWTQTDVEKMGAILPGLGRARPLTPEELAEGQKILDAEAAKEAQAKAATAAEEARQAVWKLQPEDPFRRINGERVSAVSQGWFKFWGSVRSVGPQGLVVSGSFGRAGKVFAGEFVVSNYFRPMKAGDSFRFESSWWARRDEDVVLDGQSLHRLDYGHPFIETEEDRVSQLDALAVKKAELMARAVAYNQAAADRGEADGELRMGERYRDGDGVAKDLPKAREWLAKAAAQGDKDAQKELARLPK